MTKLATAPSTRKSITERYGKKRNKKTENSTHPKQIDMTDNAIYEVLEDSSMPFEDRQQKLVEMLTVQLDSQSSVEQSQSHVQMVKDIVKDLLNRFTAHNRKSIEFTRDNPMHKLKEGMQEVFDNYHNITVGRSDLKGRLSSVNTLIADLGGEDKLVVALVEAKSRTKEIDECEINIAKTRETCTIAKDELTNAESAMVSLVYQKEDLQGALFSFMRPGVQSDITDTEQEIRELTVKIAKYKSTLSRARSDFRAAEQQLEGLTESEDYKVHQQISQILDIASPEFKTQLTELAEATLTYIDDTQRVMTQVRDQLEHIMTDVDGGLTVNVNIREQVAILSGALQEANVSSAKNLSEFKQRNTDESVSTLAKLENDKIARAGDIFVSETSSTAASVTMISSEVQKIEVVLLSLRDQLSDGLADADEQLLLAVNTASASGMVMLNRAQTLGTLAQAIISRGQYMNEAEETFGQLATDFERSLAVKAGRNDTIASLSSVVSDLTEAMSNRNDIATDIAIERHELIGDLGKDIDKLRQVAEDARELESRVNEEMASTSE